MTTIKIGLLTVDTRLWTSLRDLALSTMSNSETTIVVHWHSSHSTVADAFLDDDLRPDVFLVDPSTPADMRQNALAQAQSVCCACATYEIVGDGAWRISYVAPSGADLVFNAPNAARAVHALTWLAQKATERKSKLVSVRMPRIATPGGIPAGVGEMMSGNGWTPEHFAQKHVLVVDDDLGVAGLLKQALSKFFSVSVCGDGQSALAEIRKQWFDCVLCDVQMPGLSGIEVYRRVQRDDMKQADRFMFVTALSASILEQMSIATLGRPVIAKPFSIREVLEKTMVVASVEKE